MCKITGSSPVQVIPNKPVVTPPVKNIEKTESKPEVNSLDTKDSDLSDKSIKGDSINPASVTFSDLPKIENNGARPDTITAIKSIPPSQLESAWVGKIDSNKNPDGNSETAILTPKGFDPNKLVKIVYYFHGHNNGGNTIASSIGDLASKEKPSLSTIMQYAKENNAVVVIPQGPKKDSDSNPDTKNWMKGDGSLEKFNQDVISKIPSLKGKDVTVELNGHSAGGVAVKNLVEGFKGKNPVQNTNGGTTTIGKVNFLDASYDSRPSVSQESDRADKTYSSISRINKQSSQKINFNIVVTTNGDRTYNIDGAKVNSKNHTPADSGVTLTYKPGKSEHIDVPRNFFSGKL